MSIVELAPISCRRWATEGASAGENPNRCIPVSILIHTGEVSGQADF